MTQVDVSGEWDVRVSFLKGERTHRLHLRQQDISITGTQSSPQFEGPVSGSVDAKGIHLVFSTRYEGATSLIVSTARLEIGGWRGW
jgi:hypothetical protein